MVDYYSLFEIYKILKLKSHPPTKLITTMDDVHKQLSEDLSKLVIWIQQSKMQLNTGKPSIVWFRPHSLVQHTPPDVAFNGTSLQNVESQKYLGITFNHWLKMLL